MGIRAHAGLPGGPLRSRVRGTPMMQTAVRAPCELTPNGTLLINSLANEDALALILLVGGLQNIVKSAMYVLSCRCGLSSRCIHTIAVGL